MPRKKKQVAIRIGKKLTYLMRKHDMELEELSSLLGKEQRHLRRIKNGEVCARIDTLEEIAIQLHEPLRELVD